MLAFEGLSALAEIDAEIKRRDGKLDEAKTSKWYKVVDKTIPTDLDPDYKPQYKDGKVLTGECNGKYYKDGEILSGRYSVNYNENGLFKNQINIVFL